VYRLDITKNKSAQSVVCKSRFAVCSVIAQKRQTLRVAPFPIAVTALTAVATVLFTMQPWAPQVGEVPAQAIAVWCAVFVAALFSPHLVRRGRLAFTGREWGLVVFLVGAIGFRCWQDATWLRISQVLTGIAYGTIAGYALQVRTSQKWVLGALYLGALASAGAAILQRAGLIAWTFERTVYAATSRSEALQPSGLEDSPVLTGFIRVRDPACRHCRTARLIFIRAGTSFIRVRTARFDRSLRRIRSWAVRVKKSIGRAGFGTGVRRLPHTETRPGGVFLSGGTCPCGLLGVGLPNEGVYR
jgi:hypothetical protein